MWPIVMKPLWIGIDIFVSIDKFCWCWLIKFISVVPIQYEVVPILKRTTYKEQFIIVLVLITETNNEQIVSKQSDLFFSFCLSFKW